MNNGQVEDFQTGSYFSSSELNLVAFLAEIQLEVILLCLDCSDESWVYILHQLVKCSHFIRTTFPISPLFDAVWRHVCPGQDSWHVLPPSVLTAAD